MANPYGTSASSMAGDIPANSDRFTSGETVTLPLANGETIQLPLTAVQPYVADVTRLNSSRLGMIDLNPTRRDPATVGRTLGPIAQNYDGNVAAGKPFGDMLGFNHVMWTMIQHIDPLIEKKLVANPRFWHDRIPRGQFQLNNGAVHQSRIFRAGLQKYAGLDEWEPIDPVPSLTNDPCRFPKHGTYTYGWDQLAWSGMRSAWGSDPICSNAFRYLSDAAQQLALILEVGMERGVQMQETFNRDTYLSKATDFGRSYVMTRNFRGTGSPRYFYDPFVKFGDTGSSATKTADKAYVDRAFIVVDASEEIEPVNWTVLDKVHELLKLRCLDAAIGSDAGEPMFGLMINSEDVDASIESDERMYREWLEAKPLALIHKYNLSPKAFRRWAIVSDQNQIRFKIKHWIKSYDPETFGGVAAELSGKPVFIAVAVDPFIEDPVNKGINGGPLPIENIEYIDAELAIAPVFMNDVLTNLFETGQVSLGSGTHFGAYPALNGQWGWVLSPQTEADPFQQTGKFYGLFAIHQKPEPRVRDVISFLYRRCKETLRARCPIENKRINPDATSTTYGVSGTGDYDTAVAGDTAADVKFQAGTTFDIVLAKGSGTLFVGEEKSLAVGGTDLCDVTVVDVTSMPYVTVATRMELDNTDLASLFTVTYDATSKTATLKGKKLANASLGAPAFSSDDES